MRKIGVPLLRRTSLIFIFIVLLYLCGGQSAIGALTVSILDTVEITECHYWGYQPTVRQLPTGELVCSIQMNQNAPDVENAFWGYVISTDKGRTWGMRNTAGMVNKSLAAYASLPVKKAVLMLAGYLLPQDLRPLDPAGATWGGEDFQHLRGTSVEITDSGRTIVFDDDVELHLPKPSLRVQVEDEIHNFASRGPGKVTELAYVFFHGTILPARNGRLLSTMFGRLEGDMFFRSFIAQSDPAGRTWRYLSTIADDKSAVLLESETTGELGQHGAMTVGFSHPSMVRLTDDRLLVLMQRGRSNFIFRSWSADDGLTWREPESIGLQGIHPSLRVLRNGTLALSVGGGGSIRLYFSENGGQTWMGPTVVFNGKTSGFSDLEEVEENLLLVVYDHLPFGGIMPDWEPAAMNKIFGTFIKVKP